MATPVPRQIGKYPITAVIGEGAMGVVYKAVDPVIQRPVAIKTIHRQLLDTQDPTAAYAARFRNEAQAAGRLSHPGIVGVYEYGEDELGAYIAMEYVEGISLSRYMSRQTRFPEADILSLMSQLLEALDHAHAQGVWHRDIKPANLMVTRSGKLKVADFGIARIEAAGLTQVSATIGTPGYMAPEQYMGGAIDHRVDLFASGVLLYQLLTGQAPFAGTTEAVMYQILNQEPEPPSRRAQPPRPAVYDPIVLRALAKQADGRFPSAGAFRQALLDASVEPVSAVLSQETVIVAARPAAIGPGAPTRPTASAGTAGAPSTAAPDHWDPQTLAQLESTLARHVGPVARVLVRRAARECEDIATLATRLAEHLPQADARTAFVSSLTTRLGTSAATARRHDDTVVLGSGSRSAPGAGAGLGGPPLQPATIEQAQRVLARHIGPIASVIVRKSAAGSPSREAFFERLAAQVPDPAERARVLDDLRRIGAA